MLKLNKIIQNIAFIISVFVISFSLANFILAWTEPTLLPPAGNVSSPLNVGSTGQSKAGGLILNTGGSSNGLIVGEGNVGVGTTAPSGILSVTPSQYSTGTASQSLTTITGAGTIFTLAMVGSQFVFADGTNAGTITAYTSPTSLTVSTSQTVASQAYKIAYTGLQVDNSGNVGIGTTAPGYKLDVAGEANMTGGLLLNTSGAVNGLIVENGNVGIGTTNPQARLDVKTTDLTTVPFQVEALAYPMSGWSYKKSITINNTGGALTDYQVNLTVDTASLILAGKMNANGSDIRFRDSNNTALSYWIESGINTTTTKIWVKVHSIPASSTTTIYMYYGNPSAVSESNVNTTFIDVIPNLQLFYDFKEGSGTTTSDKSGNGNDGTLYGSPTWISGGGLSFDGVNDYVGTPLSPFPVDANITFAAWVKTTQTTTLNSILMTSETSGYGTQGLLFYNSVKASAIFGTGDGGTSWIQGTTDINDGIWHYVVATHTAAINKIYVDGVKENEATAATLSGAATSTFSVGQFGTQNGWYWNGDIKDIHVFNRALTPTEISELNNNTAYATYATYATPSYPNNVLVRASATTEPTSSIGAETTLVPLQQTVFYIQNQTGNVGIGTTAPAYKLDVQGYVQAYGYYTGDIIFSPQGTKENVWRMYEDKEGLYTQSLKTGQDILAIKSNGNVGIGTTSPGARLEVAGEINVAGISLDGTGKVVCIKSDGNLGTCSDQPGASGTCTCG